MRAGIIALGVATLIGSATPAHAFCGFYVGGAGAQMFNNATEVVLMRHGTTTVLSMQNNYQGPPEKFALVIPVPVVVREKQVKTLPREVFAKIDVLGAPRLVEYWEADPCNVDYDDGDITKKMIEEDEDGAEDSSGESDRKYKVKIEAKFSVAEYDIVVLSAQESTGLERWLRANKYEIPAGAEPLLRPYVEQGTKFFIAKVDPKKVAFQNGMATLSPLRFYYDSPEFVLPIRLGLANSSGTQDLIVNILAPNQRYEAANHPNVTIPTNLPVHDVVRTRFGEFYAALFDHTLEQVPNAVVTEYSWDSGSCDPCPGPTLDGNDLATLGSDVISSTYKDANASYTLTRLHARYGKDLKDDLVFRAVEPIEGGRGVPGANGELSTAIEKTGTNNFQGRYVIMHPWTGAVSCPTPMRGRWGGPPNGQQVATPATNTAFAPRGKVELASMVAATPQIGTLSSTPSALPMPVRAPRASGCGCKTQDGAGSAAGVFGIVLLVLRRRRRRST
jgi:MYXO-CTERM domain-containing protein